MLRSSLPNGTSFSRYKNVAERLHFAGVVIKHQQDAGERQHEEQIKRDAAHAPCEFIFHRVAIYFCGMQVEENVGENAQRAIPRRVVMLHAENRTIDLGLLGIFQAFELLFAFFVDVLAQAFRIFLDAIDQPRRLPSPFSSGIRSPYLGPISISNFNFEFQIRRSYSSDVQKRA